MEAIGVIGALVLLGILAVRFGADSRYGIRSKEEQLAARGLTWEDLWPEQVHSAPRAPRHVGMGGQRRVLSLRFLLGAIRQDRAPSAVR